MSSSLLDVVFPQMNVAPCATMCRAHRGSPSPSGTLDVPGDVPPSPPVEDNWRAEANKAPCPAEGSISICLLSLTAQWHGELSSSHPLSALKACYQRSVADLQTVAEMQKKLAICSVFAGSLR